MSKNQVTVFTARRVRTMDPGRTEVEPVAVLDGKVLSTGTVLGEDPFEVNPKQIENIKIWGTVLGGKPFQATEVE